MRTLLAGGGLSVVLAACAVAPLPVREPVTPESVLGHVERLPGDRWPGTQGHVRAREWLVATLEGWGYEVRVLPFAWEGAPGVGMANLEVRLPAREPGAPILLACAHYDGVRGSPAADDNGSGVAALLEVARRLRGRSFASELRFVWFDTEEAGMAGSRAYVRSLEQDVLSRLQGVVNLETVGYTDRRPGSQTLPPGARFLHDPGDVGDFVLVLGNVASQRLARAVRWGLEREQGDSLRVELFAHLPGAGWMLPDSRRSDHATFWDAHIPAVMLTDTANFRSPHYHGPGDRADTLDGAFLAAVTRGVEWALVAMAEQPDDWP